MSLFRFPLLRAVASTVGTVRNRFGRNHFGRKRGRSASDRAYRRLLVDPLEERQLLSLSPINVDQLLVNQTTGANLTTGAQAVAVDHDGDFVVAWTNYDATYGDGNIHARYFTDEVQRLTLPDEIAVNNLEGTFGTFSLAYNGNEVQKLEISPGYAPSTTFGGAQPPMNGQYTLSFDVDGNGTIGGGETVTVFYTEMAPMMNNSSALQTALQGLGGPLSDVTVQAITPQDFIIRFGDASMGEDQPNIIVDTFTFTAGFIPAVVVTPVRDPGEVTNIPVSPDDPELTAFAIEQWFLQNGHVGFGAPIVFPPPANIPPRGPYIFPEDIAWIAPEVSVVALSATEFDITFVGESAKIDHPELVVTAAHDDLGNSLMGSAQLDVTTLKETSPEFRVNAEELDDPFTPGPDKLNQINAAVAMDADGDFVITWDGVVLDSPGNEGTVTDIFARRFSPVGVVDEVDVEFVQGVKALGDQFRVNTFITGAQAEPDVGMDDDGNFVIAWYNAGQDVSFFNGITAQRFNRDGDRIGSEWMVNREDTMEHSEPFVAMSADGHFSISWIRGGVMAEIYYPDGTLLQGQFSPMGGFDSSATFDEWNNILYTADGRFDVDLNGALRSAGVHASMFQLYNRGGTFTPDNLNFGQIRPEFLVHNQPLWPHDQLSGQAGLDADGDIIITYSGYAPDVAQGYGIFQTELDLLVEGGLYPAQAGGADDEALALMRYGTDMTMDYLRGEADGVMYTRIDADPLLQTGYLEMDSVANTLRDGHNEKDLIEIDGRINGGSFIMWLFRDGVGGFDQIEVEVVVSDGDPPFLLPGPTALAIEQALTAADRTGVAWPEPTFMGPVNVRVVGAGEIMQRQGTYWDMGVNPANYVFEVTFLGSSHDWGFDLMLAMVPGANSLTIDGDPGPPPVFIEYAKGYPGVNQDNSAMGIEPDGDFVVAWTQFEPFTNWQTHITDTRPLHPFPNNNAPNNVYYRRFDESTDTAGPKATDFLLPSGGRLDDGAQVSEDLQFIIVTFDEKMRTDGSENDVTDTRNWALMQDSVEVLGGISEVHFGMNMAKTLGLTGIASNKWEAVVMLDGNGQTAGTPALTEGTYEIVALNSLRDEVGNALGRTGFEINGQSFSREFYVSIPSGDEILVNDDPAGDQSTFPESPQTIAGDADGDHVVVWTNTGADPGVYAKLYDTVWTDTPSGRESTITAIGQIQVTDDPTAMYASVARDDDGDFVVTWSAYDAGGTSWNVWFQRYDALGRPQGDAEMANAHTEDIQRFSTVAMDNDGDFVVTWQSQNQDGSGYGIFAQRYTRAGDVIDGLDEIQVVRFTGNPEGTFGLTWEGHVTGPISYSGDISDVADQIQAEFDALGVAVDVQPHGYTEVTIRFTDELRRTDQPPIMMDFVSIEGMPGADISVGTLIDGVTSEFRVNDTTSGNQRFPSIAMESGGTFLVTWTSSGQDGDDSFETNVYAKLFEGAGIGGSYSGGGGGAGVGGGGPGGGPGGGGVQVYVDPGEQLFVYLLNRARNDPQAYEAERDLPISLAGVAPQPALAVNYNLFDSSGFKSGEMAQFDYFAHQSEVTGQWPNELLRDYGYPLDPTFPDDANFVESLAAGTFIDTAAEALELLIIDAGVVPPGHRIHLLSMNNFGEDDREIGVGYAVSDASMYTNYWTIHLTRSDPADRFITGVVYSDANGNGLYDINEGIGGVRVDAGGQVAISNSAGGYSIEVQPGDYTVTASGGSYNGVGSTVVTVNGGNVEVDFISGQDGAWVDFDYVAGGPAAPGPGGGGGTGVVTLTNEFLVNETTDYNQNFSTVAMDTDGDFVVSWTSYGQDEVGSGYGPGVDGENGVYARRYNADATPSGGEFQANTYAAENQQYSRISMDADGDFMIAWESFQDRSEGSGAGNNYGIYAQRYSANAGGPFLGPNGEIGSELAVNSTKSGDQRWPGIALNNTGDAIVVWSGNGVGDDQGIFLQRYEKPADTAGPIVTDVHDVGSDTGGVTLDYVLENDVINTPVSRFVVTFGEDLNTEYGTIGTTSVLNTNNWELKKNGETISGGVAEVEFGLNQAFVSGLADAPSNKYEAVITFDLDPTKEGEQRLDDGEYVLTVSHYVQDLFGNYLDGDFDGYPGGVFDRTFFVVTADTEFRVNDDPDGDQYTLPDGLAEDEIPNSPQAVADDANGDYVVVWTSDGAAGHAAGVYATLYKTTWTNLEPGRDSDVAVFDEILVTPDPTATYASVAMDADGDFVVTWSAYDEAGATGWDVWYMRFDAMRRPQMADPEMVNTYTDGDQRFSTVAMDHDGDFVITWQSSGQEGSGYEVYAQRYNRAGDALGGLSGEVRVNDTTEGDQRFPTVAMDAVGDFVVSWTSSGQDGDGPNENNIFAKRFVSNDTIFGTGNSPGNSIKKSDPPSPESVAGQKILTVDDPANHIVPPGTDADGIAMVWDVFGGMGSGSLLSSGRHILTAAHVVSDWFGNALPPSMITTVFNLPDGDIMIGSSQIFVHPNYNGDSYDGYDLAIITLQQTAPTQIPRYDIYRESNELGQTFLQFGFGASGTGDTGEDPSVPSGIRRSGQNQYEGLGTMLGYDAGLLVYDFDNGQAANDALGQNYGIANTGLGDAETNSGHGDSGGPCFINGLIAGITCAEAHTALYYNTDVTPGILDCSFGEISVDIRISVFADWIDGIVGAGGAEFRVNETVSSNQQWSSVAMDPTGKFVITWTNYGDPIDSSSNEIGPSGQQDIFGRLYDNEANATTGEFMANTYSIGTQQHSHVAMDIQGNFVVTWESFEERSDPSFGMSDVLNTFGIRAQKFSQQGWVGDEFAVNATTAGHQRLPGVAVDDTGDFVIVWSGNGEMPGEEDDQGIFARRFDMPTDVAGATVTDVDNVVTLDGGVIALEHVTEDIVLFTEVDSFVITFGENLNFDFFESGVHSVVNPANWTLTQDGQTIPGGVASIRFGLNEAHNWNAAIPESNKYEAVLTFDLDAEEPGYQPLDSGRFVVTVGSSIWDLFDNPLDGDVNGVSGDPFAIAFNLFDAVPGDPGDDDIDNPVNTTDVGDQNDSAVARNDNGDYVVVWVDYSSLSGQADIMGQRFDFVGRMVDNEFLVNNLTTNDQIEPDVAIDNDGNFVVVWSGDGDRLGDDSGVFAQLYDADGRTVGGQFLVNQFTQDTQDAPAVAVNADGEFLVTWTSFGQDGGRDGIFARWFDPLGQPMGDEFLVNTTTVHAQRTPDVAINGSGDFVITWASDGQDANDWGVYAQRFDAASNRIGGEFRVNEYQNDEQIDPQIAMTEEGSFVITWASYLQDGSGFGIYARLYDAAGNAGNEFRVNETTIHWQQEPAVAMNSTKGFVITWTSFNQDNPHDDDLRDNGIFARMFNADGSNYLADDGSVLGEFRVNANTVGDQVEPAVSMDALGIYVVTWTGPDPFLGIDTDIYSRLLDPPIEVDTTVTYTDVHLTGTEGDDLFEFVAGQTSALWIVKINGQMQYVGDTVGILTFDGLGGTDTVLITGTGADETLEMWPDHGTYGDGGYVLELSNVEMTTAVGGGGTDVAYLHDSVGDDTFTSTPIDAELTGDGFALRAESFRYAHGFADAGGTDLAMLYDSPGDDTFTSYPAYVRMTGEGFYTKAHGFEYAKGYSYAGGDDVADLYDSPGDDTYVATPEYSKLYGESFYTLAVSFPYTKAYSRAGGTDVAIMTDSPGDDILVATPTYAKFYGETFYNRADGFDYVKAYGKNGGDDVASLHDSAGDDRFVAGPHYGKMYGDGFYIRADFFRYVTGYASNGGNDVADLYDSAGDDFLVVTPLYGKLYNDTFYNRAYTFETVNARATAGGTDVAHLFDSAMNEYLEADDNWARLSNVDLDFSYWVADFDQVTAHSSNSGDTKHVAPTVDFLIANGMWEDE